MPSTLSKPFWRIMLEHTTDYITHTHTCLQSLKTVLRDNINKDNVWEYNRLHPTHTCAQQSLKTPLTGDHTFLGVFYHKTKSARSLLMSTVKPLGQWPEYILTSNSKENIKYIKNYFKKNYLKKKLNFFKQNTHIHIKKEKKHQILSILLHVSVNVKMTRGG